MCSCAAPAAATSRGCARSTTRSRPRSTSPRPEGCSTASAAAPAATSSGSCRTSSTWTSPRPSSGWPPGRRSSCATSTAARPQPNRQPGQRARLKAAHAAAAAFYAEQLSSPEAKPAREFLAGRGFDQSVAERFGCGYAPSGWDALTKHLLAQRVQRRRADRRRAVPRGRPRRPDRPVPPPAAVADPRRRRRGRRLRRAAAVRRRQDRGQVPEHPRDADLQEEPAALRRRHREAGDRAPAPRGDRRGLHRRHGLPPRRVSPRPWPPAAPPSAPIT